MGHPYPIREIARQAGVGEATVDRVLNNRAGVRASTAARVQQAIVDLDRQQTQLKLTGRSFIVDVLMHTPDRFSSAIKDALERALALAGECGVIECFITRWACGFGSHIAAYFAPPVGALGITGDGSGECGDGRRKR